MMNHRRTERLTRVLEQPEGVAVAITGAWGVGKTYFWKNFIKQYPLAQDQQYAYVSVFGVETLADLKALIVEQLEADPNDPLSFTERAAQFTKRAFRDLRGMQVDGMSLSGSLLFLLLFNKISNALICIDDLERKSDKLSIKDIMGLADFLKNQRACKVVIILNDQQDHEGVYDDYKEKIFDDCLIVKDISQALHCMLSEELAVVRAEFLRFYECFGLENIRFYKKALRVFADIYSYLPAKHSESAVKQIAQSTLVFLAITDMPSMGLEWADLNPQWTRKSVDDNHAVAHLKQFYGGFFVWTEWHLLLKKFFQQDHADWSEQHFQQLAQSDLISEEKQTVKDQLTQLIDDFYNFKAGDDFGHRLYQMALENINSQGVVNTYFYVNLLTKCGLLEQANHLETKVLEWVETKVRDEADQVDGTDDFFMFGKEGCEDIYRKTQEVVDHVENTGYRLADVMTNYVKHNRWKSLDEKVIRDANKDDWHRFLFVDTVDGRFGVIRAAWSQKIMPSKTAEIRQWIRELMLEKRQESVAMRVAVDHMLSLLDDRH